MKIHSVSVLIAAGLLSSCQLMGPNFGGAPDQELPISWQNAMPPSSSAADLSKWWESFGDAQLTDLINRGFLSSPDMINSALAIARAESSLRSMRSGLFPTVSASLGGTNSGSFSTSNTHGSWSGGLSASWTPDIWGGTRREIEAAFASLGSTQAAANATRTALASSIATAYFEWISAKESLRIAKEQLEYQERTYNIVQRKAAVGMVANLELAEARSTIASTRAQIPTYEANIKSCENTLATLLGTTVDNIHLRMPSAGTYNKIPRVPTGLPSELLRRRPDIIKAEKDLHRATASIGVSVANLFPSLSLTGRVSGSSGSDFAHFFSNSAWSLGASASQTIFNRTKLKENVKMAELERDSAAQSYRKTVLSAFAEVEECLISYARLTNQLPQHQAAAAANKQAAELSLRRFNSGQSDFLNVASSERAWLSSELNLISTRQQIRMTLARLCTALGGGW
ncbi:MAG: efflux transporter outer membrane subunit [Akkermansia sp.]|nr:efflux transporter outer membrane subunit [Akkermansia sp.]